MKLQTFPEENSVPAMLLVAQMLIKHSHMTDGAKSIAGHEVLAQVAAVYCLTVCAFTVAVLADQLSVNLHTQSASQGNLKPVSMLHNV